MCPRPTSIPKRDIITIGGSAGALDAICDILAALPRDLPRNKIPFSPGAAKALRAGGLPPMRRRLSPRLLATEQRARRPE
jgi:hypothetical protein